MFMAERATGHLIEIADTHALFDPHITRVKGCMHYGEEAQDPEFYEPSALGFPGGEALPRRWPAPFLRRQG